MSDGKHKHQKNVDDALILRNAVIEGAWAFTTYAIGTGVAGLRMDVVAWSYGAVTTFMAGFIGYLVKSYKLGGEKKS